MPNSNPIAVVTGASRGAGAGIARALGARGYTVYVTGRTERVDMAVDLEGTGIAAVSIWMGSLLTQRVRDIVARNPAKLGHILDTAETPELTGRVISRLYEDAELAQLSGQTLIGAELAVKYGIKDDGDRQPPSCRELHGVYPHRQFPYVMR